MKVKVLLNYQKNGRVHLINDVLDIDASDFDERLHSEMKSRKPETGKQKAANGKKTPKKAGDV